MPQPVDDVNTVGMEGHLESQIVINGVLADSLHEEARPAYVGRPTDSPGILVGSQQRKVAVQVDATAEVMQVSRHDGITPTVVVRRITFTAVQVKDEQIRLGDGLDDRLAQAPSLHGPHGVRVEVPEKPMDRLPHAGQVLRRIDGRRAFMERVGRINTVRAVKPLLLLQEVAAYDLKQRIGGVELGDSPETAPRRLRPDAGTGIFCLQLARHVAREALLDGLHTQLQLTVDYLFPQLGVAVYPRLG